MTTTNEFHKQWKLPPEGLEMIIERIDHYHYWVGETLERDFAKEKNVNASWKDIAFRKIKVDNSLENICQLLLGKSYTFGKFLSECCEEGMGERMSYFESWLKHIHEVLGELLREEVLVEKNLTDSTWGDTICELEYVFGRYLDEILSKAWSVERRSVR